MIHFGGQTIHSGDFWMAEQVPRKTNAGSSAQEVLTAILQHLNAQDERSETEREPRHRGIERRFSIGGIRPKMDRRLRMRPFFWYRRLSIYNIIQLFFSPTIFWDWWIRLYSESEGCMFGWFLGFNQLDTRISRMMVSWLLYVIVNCELLVIPPCFLVMFVLIYIYIYIHTHT